MQTLTRPKPSWPNEIIPRTARRHKHISPLMFVGMIVTLMIAMGAGVLLVARPWIGSHAAAANADCTLIVPPNPLSAQGLATPYQLTATDRAMGSCLQANAKQSAFVQGAILDPATGQISVYNPLVIDKGRKAAIAPVIPTLPQGAVVALWFGFNGNNLTLTSQENSLQDGKCINGLNNSIFGQFAYCNAPAFFASANQAIQAGKLMPPALGMAKDGQPCPTVRDFSVVDQDQSDNVTTTYLITQNGQSAQMTTANMTNLQNAQVQVNGSDNRLLDVALDGALGCTPWMAPNLADPGQMTTALPLNELQAATHQAAPIALVPNQDPMVLVNGKNNLEKVNLYRQGVNQPSAQNNVQANTLMYCKNLLARAPSRIMLDASLTQQRPSPDPAVATNLFTFLAQRFNTTWGANGGLNCQGVLKMNSPIQVTTDANGVAIDATNTNVRKARQGQQEPLEQQGQLSQNQGQPKQGQPKQGQPKQGQQVPPWQQEQLPQNQGLLKQGQQLPQNQEQPNQGLLNQGQQVPPWQQGQLPQNQGH